MRRFTKKVILGALLAVIWVAQASALVIGTFNIEYFNVSGKKAYSQEDCSYLARLIEESDVDLLALQEIEGDATMRFFVTKFLPGWAYSGNDTGGRQDLYFLWRKDRVRILDGPVVYGANGSFRFEGKSYRLHDRPPMVGVFLDIEGDRRFHMVNVHLKSQSTRGKDDQDRAKRYNDFKRGAQIDGINGIVGSLKGPVFILGDYNVDDPKGTNFPLLSLPKGSYSYDDRKSRLDYIGYSGIERSDSWRIIEVETSIPARSTKRSQSPDHDMVLLDLNWDGSPSSTKDVYDVEKKEQIVYVTATGKKYHSKGCSYLKGKGEPMSLDKAKSLGYSPCSRCNPPR